MKMVGSLLIRIFVMRLRVTPALAPTGSAWRALMLRERIMLISEDLPTLGTPIIITLKSNSSLLLYLFEPLQIIV